LEKSKNKGKVGGSLMCIGGSLERLNINSVFIKNPEQDSFLYEVMSGDIMS